MKWIPSDDGTFYRRIHPQRYETLKGQVDQNGLATGHGTLKRFDREGGSLLTCYVGSFVKNQYEGQGRLCVWPDKNDQTIMESYSGNWFKGQAHGRGEHRHTDGTNHKGTFKNGEPCGYGERTYPDGQCRRCIFAPLPARKRGRGASKEVNENGTADVVGGPTEILYPNGDLAAGILDAACTGKGVYRYSASEEDDFELYKGELVQGKSEGLGRLQFLTGDLIVGRS